ncbi:MAG: hypothetical protein NZV14_13715 [Bryobacteraceae bacterium]|nr:hypothetical protein [Bryobacteraceae bacterium]MDW8379216.1 hypothetical protein [Bryobacterales bacterium]
MRRRLLANLLACRSAHPSGTSLLGFALTLALPLLVEAQYRYPRHNVHLGLGAGVPQADLRPLFDPKVGFRFGYGYRFQRFFQADLGLDTVVGAAGVRDFLQTQLGVQRIRDFQYFLPLGGRAIIPLAGDRLLIHAGGGGAYMRYAERISQPSDYIRLACPVCGARSGWGYYSQVGFSVAMDRFQRFRLGVVSRVYRGYTNGEAIGAVPGVRTRDHWVNTMAEFGVAF